MTTTATGTVETQILVARIEEFLSCTPDRQMFSETEIKNLATDMPQMVVNRVERVLRNDPGRQTFSRTEVQNLALDILRDLDLLDRIDCDPTPMTA